MYRSLRTWLGTLRSNTRTLDRLQRFETLRELVGWSCINLMSNWEMLLGLVSPWLRAHFKMKTVSSEIIKEKNLRRKGTHHNGKQFRVRSHGSQSSPTQVWTSLRTGFDSLTVIWLPLWYDYFYYYIELEPPVCLSSLWISDESHQILHLLHALTLSSFISPSSFLLWAKLSYFPPHLLSSTWS